MANKKRRILYLSYDGMLEPLGQSQVLSYLKLLARDCCIHLVSYEKKEDWNCVVRRSQLQEEVARAGIAWHPLRYHKRPTTLATAWDIGAGISRGTYLVLRHRLGIVHARSYVPSVMALIIKRLTGSRYLFDMRGFWVDERVDGNIWTRNSRLYRIGKWFERRFLTRADHVVSLTYAAVGEMRKLPYLARHAPPMTVIPTCADLERFRPAEKRTSSRFVLGYVGSAGTWYNFDAAVAAFTQLRLIFPDALFLIVNRNEHAFVRERLKAAGVTHDAFELRAADHAEVPLQMGRMTASVFFVKPTFSKQASAPTRLAEFLGCGIPCLSNAGVGDMATILEENQVGVAVHSFAPENIEQGINKLIDLTRDQSIGERCVGVARHHFHLAEGAKRYAEVYEQLGNAT